MKGFLLLGVSGVFVIFTAFSSLGAPYYKGIGCNEQGRNCFFGIPSGQVLEWSRAGHADELGHRCEIFLKELKEGLERVEMTHSLKGNFSLKKPTYSPLENPWTKKVVGKVCRVEIHSESPNVRVLSRVGGKKYWIYNDVDASSCIDKKTGQSDESCVDRAYQAQCLDSLTAIKSEPLAVAPYVSLSWSLTQGDMCRVRYVKIAIDSAAQN